VEDKGIGGILLEGRGDEEEDERAAGARRPGLARAAGYGDKNDEGRQRVLVPAVKKAEANVGLADMRGLLLVEEE